MDEKRLARLITDAVVRRPLLWRLLRPRMRGLPFETGSFDLVVLMTAVPFFDELAGVTAPGGSIVFSFSRGPETPIYVAEERLGRELSKRGFTGFRSFSADPATAFRAQRL